MLTGVHFKQDVDQRDVARFAAQTWERDGQPRMLLITGNAMTGKSSLLTHLATLCQPDTLLIDDWVAENQYSWCLAKDWQPHGLALISITVADPPPARYIALASPVEPHAPLSASELLPEATLTHIHLAR